MIFITIRRMDVGRYSYVIEKNDYRYYVKLKHGYSTIVYNVELWNNITYEQYTKQLQKIKTCVVTINNYHNMIDEIYFLNENDANKAFDILFKTTKNQVLIKVFLE